MSTSPPMRPVDPLDASEPGSWWGRAWRRWRPLLAGVLSGAVATMVFPRGWLAVVLTVAAGGAVVSLLRGRRVSARPPTPSRSPR